MYKNDRCTRNKDIGFAHVRHLRMEISEEI